MFGLYKSENEIEEIPLLSFSPLNFPSRARFRRILFVHKKNNGKRMRNILWLPLLFFPSDVLMAEERDAPTAPGSHKSRRLYEWWRAHQQAMKATPRLEKAQKALASQQQQQQRWRQR